MAVKEKLVFKRRASSSLTEMTYDDLSVIETTRKPTGLFAEAPEIEEKEDYDNPVVRAIEEKKAKKRRKRGILFKGALVFSLGLLVVFRYASITEMGYKVAEADNELTQITAENERLDVSIESRLNIGAITEVAKEKFGMQQPQTYQMKVIPVNPLDQTEVYKDVTKEEEKDDRAWYKKAWDFILEFLGLI